MWQLLKYIIIEKNIGRLLPSLFFLGIILYCHNSDAQIKDARLWVSAGIEKKITGKFSAICKISSRLINNNTEVGSMFADMGAKYKLGKKFKVGVHYRYTIKRNNLENNSIKNRFFINISYKVKFLSPIVFTISSAYQREYIDMFTQEEGLFPDNAFREELLLSYKYKKYEPYLGVEVFYFWNYSKKYFSRVRTKLGVEYSVNKRNKLEFFYMIQQALNVKNPSKYFIGSVGYKYYF